MTQGLVTIVEDGTVRLKIVAGNNGKFAQAVANDIAALPELPPLEEVYEIATKRNFGYEETLVVIDAETIFHKTGKDLDDRYRETFGQPRFNPRWENGTADHTVVISR